MSDQGELSMNIPFEDAVPKGLSKKQNLVMAFLMEKGTMTLDDAVGLIGYDIYCNERFHVGNILSNMVKRKLIARVAPGVFSRI